MAGTSLYQDEGQSSISDINVTPLVDVTLVLLIIFMVTAKLIVARGISVESPKTASGDEVKTRLQITFDKERNLFVNGTPYQKDVAAARARVAEVVRENPEVKAVITADTSVSHGEVMQIVDFVHLAGAKRFALASDPLSKGEVIPLGAPPAATQEGAPPGAPEGAR